MASSSASRLARPRRRLRLNTSVATIVLGLLVASCAAPAPSTDPSPKRAGAPTESAQPTGRACAAKPSAENTGARGKLADTAVTVLGDGQTLQDARVGGIAIQGAGVTLRNVEATGNIFITGDGATIDHVTTTGIAISSASDVTVRYADIGNSTEDGIHVTSDRGRLVKNVTLEYNFVHTPQVPDSAHYDGTQVRGVKGLVISCSTYDPGSYRPPYNAAVYLEDANGGDSEVAIRDNWLYGFGFSVMVDTNEARIVDNRVGGDPHWGTCLVGRLADQATLQVRGNVNDKTGEPDPMCAAPSAKSR